MEYSELIRARRSYRCFRPEPVPAPMVETIAKAGLLAPSGKSVYPCHFIIVDDAAELQQLSQAKAQGASLLAHAPVAIVVVADTAQTDVWIEDASIATTLIMLEAENQGLGACWVQMRLRSGANGEPATNNLRTVLNLSDSQEVLAVVAVGYKVEPKPAYTDADLKTDRIHRLKM